MILTNRQVQNVDYLKNKDFGTLDPIKDIPKDAAITIVGRRRSGKSELMRDLDYNLRKNYKSVYLFSNTADTQLGFWDFVPKENIIKGIDELKLRQIFDEQKDMINDNKKKGLLDKSKMDHCMLIFDDLIQGNSGLRSADFLAEMYANGRHYCCCCILAVQSFKSVMPMCRENSDVSIAFRFKNGDTVDDFVKENFNVPNIDLGRRIFSSVVCDPNKSYQCIAVLSHLHSDDPFTLIKKYTAKIIDDKFVIGNSKNDYISKKIFKDPVKKKSSYIFYN